jgi:CheY-like chemotaxis protein
MTLSSMVVSRDWQEVSVLECILGGLHMDVAVEAEPRQALARMKRSKVDALIVDCDLSGTTQFLRELQRDSRRSSTVPLVIVSGSKGQHDLDATGALFAFAKPISVEQAVHTLSAARNMILDGRLRYHRANLDVSVSVMGNSRECSDGQLINVSQGGIQVRMDRAFEGPTPLRVSFELPGAKCAVKTRAEVAWRDERGNVGIRFLDVPLRSHRALQLWLARQYFAN